MYGPKWPFLLMYMSHDMKHRYSAGVTGCQRDTPGFRESHSMPIGTCIGLWLGICVTPQNPGVR